MSGEPLQEAPQAFWSGLLWMRSTLPSLAQGPVELKHSSRKPSSGKGFLLRPFSDMFTLDAYMCMFSYMCTLEGGWALPFPPPRLLEVWQYPGHCSSPTKGFPPLAVDDNGWKLQRAVHVSCSHY